MTAHWSRHPATASINAPPVIRNPLNFVKNFSEVSEELLKELLEELHEILRERDDKKDEDRRALIQEIAGDVTDNLKRIREHGERANLIVHHMLMMGRGSGERQPTDINALLEEHARLAYQSARASNSDFHLEVKEYFDPEVGALDIIPQDMGRVFLNLVGNACQATDEKRRAADAGAEARPGSPAPGEDRYEPALTLATRRTADGIEVRIRDNGGGIPPDVIDKIFNPFFTTKPPDQGTGLGLALSNDIVRQHWGEIRVESRPGAFTEMVVALPLVPPTATAQGGEPASRPETSAPPPGSHGSE